MKIKEYQFSKHYKKGLPNYSSVDCGFGLIIEAPEGEEIDRKAVWNLINAEILENLTIEEDWIAAKDKGEKTARYQQFRKNTA